MKKTYLATVMALAIAPVANAALQFDPDGTGPLGALTIGAFDWGPTSFLAQGGNAAISSFLADELGLDGTAAGVQGTHPFNIFTHASVVGFSNAGGGALPNPAGLNSSFELTMIAGFGERVTSVALGFDASATFRSLTDGQLADGSSAFFEIYYHDTVNASPLSGSGYKDGQLIARATKTASNVLGNFSVDGAAPLTDLDSSGNGDQWPGVDTVTGTGSQVNLPVLNFTFLDPDFFKSTLQSLTLQFANISIGLPFISVDPSDCFNNPGNPGCTADAGGDPRLQADGPIIPNVGPVNGLFVGLTAPNPDFLAQTDFNSPTSGVPEPTSVALIGLGLSALGIARRRRKV